MKMTNYVLKSIKSRFTLFLLSTFVALTLSACGGGGGGSSDTGSGGGSGEIIGTGFMGKTAVGDAIANADIQIKSLSGTTVTTSSDINGDFNSPELIESSASTPRGPYLLRVDTGDDNYLYSIAHSENSTNTDSNSASIVINIHPYTDLIIRNWFAQNNYDIDIEFSNTDGITELPSSADIDAISNEFLAILENVLNENGAPTDTNLLSSPFEIDGTGFDGFLDNSSVNINNNIINVIINQVQVSNPIQTNIINNISLNTNFTDTVDTPPSLPQNVRTLPTDMDGEIVIVWEPSTDDKGVSQYNIYRNTTLVASTPFPVFIDMGLTNGVEYNYTIEAIDSRDQTSGLTIPSVITLDLPDASPPPTPTSLLGTEANNIINLTWTQLLINDVAGFQILRGPSGNVITEIANTTTTAFSDFNVIPGTTYCYRVISYDASGNESSPTEETCVEVSGVISESTVRFSAENYSEEESAGSIIITVNRSGDVSQAISVDYSAIAGTATADSDFVETSGTLNWQATDSEAKSFTVQINETSDVENNETVILELSNPSINLVNGNDSAVLTITDAPQLTCIDLSPTTITTNTTLSEPCYNVNSNVAIRNAATLTIDPGVRLQFAQGVNFEVEADGVLNASGTSQDPIVFTGELPATGYWDGIEIRSVSNSQIDHAVIEYGGSNSSFNPSNIGVSFDGQVSITNSVIRYSANHGVSYSSSSSRLTAFTNNTVTLNEDAPIATYAGQIGDLSSNNSFTGNITTLSGNRDYIDILSGDSIYGVNTNQTWNAFDVDYRMPSGSTVINAELTIAPGVRLLFPSDAQLDIRSEGTLKAIGTALEPIVFTGLQASVGFWQGIQFTFNNNDNVMDHSIVEYGGGPGGNTVANVGVYGSNGRLTISNTILRESAGYGFQFDSNIELNMNNVTSTSNNQPGSIAFNDVGLLDGDSFYSGNNDDRVILANLGVAGNLVDSTIQNISIPYFVSRDSGLTQVQAQLTIEPGTEIQFNSTGGLNIESTGTLIAQGTPAEPIILTGAQQTKGYWTGIQFTFSNNPSVIDNAIVEYAGGVGGNTQALIGLYGGTGLPQTANITNNTLRHSATNGIQLSNGSNGVFSGNIFEDIDGENILDPR